MAKRSKAKKPARREVSTQAGVAVALPPPPWFRRDWFWGLILVLAVVLVYQPVWYAGFIWDDDAHVTHPALRSWAGLGRIWFDLGATQQYYPLVHSVFWVEHRLWGDAPLGYHLVNVLLHAFSALLLLKILRRLDVPGAWLAAALFALHPVQVETVAWASELKNVLSGVFYFGSALLYLEVDRTRKMKAYASSLILFVLGLMSKSVIATLPAALLVVFWWKRGKLSWIKDAGPLAPFFVAGMGSGLLTAWVERHFVGAEGADYNYTLIERFLIAGRALWFYLGKLAWPADLIFIYPRWEVSQDVGWQYLFPAAVMILVVTLWWLSRRWRGPLAGFLFFAGTLFPALGFFNVYPFRYSFVADHFQYLACLGIIVPGAAGAARLAEFVLPEKPWWRIAPGAALVFILGFLSWQRTWAYENVEKLWTDTLARNPDCWMAHNNLGYALYQNGHADDAMAQYQKALQINPDYAEAHNNLGSILLDKGQVDRAMAQYQKALEISPNFANAYYGLGNAFLQKGRLDEAMVQYQKVLELNPGFEGVDNGLGNVLLQMGRVDEAIAHYQKALDLDPNFAEARNNLGSALLRQGQVTGATAQFQMALQINPDYADAHTNLGLALSRSGQLDEAMVQYQKALQINPTLAEAHNNLGWALVQKGRLDEAMPHLQKALQINPHDADAHNNLGIALANQGHLDEALAQFHEALRLKPGDVNAQNNLIKVQARARQAPGAK